MHEEKIEGIVLRAQDYQEHHRIITLFSPQGLMSAIVKCISSKNARLLTLTTPFTHGEYIFLQGRSELFRFQDGTVLDDHFSLRLHLKSLQAAGALAHAILASQMFGKPAPMLFALYKSYHKQVCHFDDPTPLLASFYLKLLKHEGLLSISSRCARCGKMTAQFLQNGESFCSQDAGQGAVGFSSSEWDKILSLEGALQFAVLHKVDLPPLLLEKIQALFSLELTACR